MAETTSFPNTLIYECSSANATVQIAENEWVNEFKEGVDLKPGDTIRILGSFINEKGSGDQIEITKDNNKFTLEYLPIHNLYQYTKLSDGYKMPNDDTRTKLEKFQYSQVLNFDTPKMYDGNGNQILPLKGEGTGADPSARQPRWFDSLPWNTYHNKRGYDDVNPNTQYYDCELIKTISVPYVDGIRLKWRSKADSSVYQTQEILFDTADESPYAGPANPYVGNPNRQLAFGSVYSYFTWNGNEDSPEFTMESTDIPVGVTGKVIGLKYSVNKGSWVDRNSGVEWDAGLVPMANFMVGDHTIQTKVNKDQINPTTEPYKSSTGTNGIWDSQEDPRIDFNRYNSSPFFNAQNGPVNDEGQTWTLQEQDPDQMTSGFSSGVSDNSFKSCLDYDFYCVGPSTWTRDFAAMDRTNYNQQQMVSKVGLAYNYTTKKYFYQLELSAFWDADFPAFASKIYFAFLRAYDPNSMTEFKRLYLPISLSEAELSFVSSASFDYDSTLTATDVGNGALRYTDGSGTDAKRTTSGGVKVGISGMDPNEDPFNIETTYGDQFQQTIKPGFQTNINMWDGTPIKTLEGPDTRLRSPLEYFTRKAGSYPSTDYAQQLQDIADYKQDCWMIQSKKANFEIPTGFYTPDRLANVVNDLLHLNRKEYENKFGEGNITLANKDDNWAYAPGYINGPFVQTKIPEINGGIIAPDLSASNMTNPSLSNRPPGITLDSPYITMTTEYLANDGIDALALANNLAGDRSDIVVLNMKDQYRDINQMIFVPHPMSRIEGNLFFESSESYYRNIDDTSLSSDTPGQKTDTEDMSLEWINLVSIAERAVPIFVGMGPYICDGRAHDYSGTAFAPSTSGELGDGVLGRTTNIPFGNLNTESTIPTPLGYYAGFPYVASYTNRTNGGITSGGLSRFFSGANDLTFLYDNDEERFAFSNTYTPFRPAGFESSQDKEEFTVDDAVPSVLINTIYNGYNLFATTQIYILSLAAPPVCVETSNQDDRQGKMPSIKNPVQQQAGAIDFWTSLGFTDLPSYEKDDSGNITITESRWIDDIYFQENLDTSTGKKPILNIAEIDPSSNAANPAKSQCLTMMPNRQFLIQTISDELKASNPATLTTYPFYLIGSSIPSGFYHGSDTGTELPVVGLCSRNFSAGSFVFDLSQSSVEWTISENITLTSIRTKILKNDFSAATNLFGNSAIVYAITKQNFYNEIPQPLSGQIEKQREDELEKDIKTYENAPIPVQPAVTYMIPSVPYQQLIYDDSD